MSDDDEFRYTIEIGDQEAYRLFRSGLMPWFEDYFNSFGEAGRTIKIELFDLQMVRYHTNHPEVAAGLTAIAQGQGERFRELVESRT